MTTKKIVTGSLEVPQQGHGEIHVDKLDKTKTRADTIRILCGMLIDLQN